MADETRDPARPPRSGAREASGTTMGGRWRAAAYALLVAGALGGVAAANATWRHAVDTFGRDEARTGVAATGTLALVLAGVVAAGTLLSLTLRRRGRRILGVPLALVAIGMVMTGVARLGAPGATWLPLAYAVAGLLALVGVVVLELTVHRWPVAPDRYARRRRSEQTVADDDPAEVWKALDEGLDPTRSGRSAGTAAADRSE